MGPPTDFDLGRSIATLKAQLQSRISVESNAMLSESSSTLTQCLTSQFPVIHAASRGAASPAQDIELDLTRNSARHRVPRKQLWFMQYGEGSAHRLRGTDATSRVLCCRRSNADLHVSCPSHWVGPTGRGLSHFSTDWSTVGH